LSATVRGGGSLAAQRHVRHDSWRGGAAATLLATHALAQRARRVFGHRRSVVLVRWGSLNRSGCGDLGLLVGGGAGLSGGVGRHPGTIMPLGARTLSGTITSCNETPPDGESAVPDR